MCYSKNNLNADFFRFVSMTNVKMILGTSLIAAFTVMLVSSSVAYAGAVNLDIFDLTEASVKEQAEKSAGRSGNTTPAHWDMEAKLATSFNIGNCPVVNDDGVNVCGVGVFTDPDFEDKIVVADIVMITAAVHDDFCDHVFQDPDAANNADCDGGAQTLDVQHPHNLYFNLDPECEASFQVAPGFGAALVAEDDIDEAKLELAGNKVEITDIPSNRILDATVHTFSVDLINGNTKICAVLHDNLTNEEEDD
jgi:hypothetical protein